MSSLSDLVAALDPQKRALLAELVRPTAEPIAIVGMGCRLPGDISTPEAFWDLLQHGNNVVGDVPADRWDTQASGASAQLNEGIRQGAFLSDLAGFDAEFFGFSHREALRLDPQHRLLLEVAWEALEHAGMAADRLAGSLTGVFVGITDAGYGWRQLRLDPDCLNDPYFPLGSEPSAAAGRLAYHLDVRGPTIPLDTACSSSLVAVALACQSLRARECELALAGGAYAVSSPDVLRACGSMGMLASDGRCRTFDARADGFGVGEGCGIVVLKRLSDARAQGDSVLAVIRGAAVNHDGRTNGLTAPNGLAQQAVIRRALVDAGVDPRLVSYVEAHGSATPLGDPIEIEALRAVLEVGRAPDSQLAVGSVKSNVGHLVCAAGVAGLVKTMLALQHRAIPPHVGLRERNPAVAWDDDRLTVPTALMPWRPIEGRRVAGVSSFGWSGTNAHVVVEEAEPGPPSGLSRPWQLLPISARTGSALDQATKRLAEHLGDPNNEDVALADVAYTLQLGRASLVERRVVVARDAEDAARALAELDPERVLSGTAAATSRPVTFMFPGLGDQYIGMAAELYQSEPAFREHVDRCCELLRPLLDEDLREVLQIDRPPPPVPENEAGRSFDLRRMLGQDSAAHGALADTALAQPAVFVIEYALAQLWMSWGVQPQALAGYSLGEYVAACLAGVFSLEDALRVVAERARLIGSLPAGAMLAVTLAEEGARVRMDGVLSLAAVNGPLMSVVAGEPRDVERLERELAASGVACRRIQTTHAFHSRQMEPILSAFGEVLRGVKLNAPRIACVSNVTGTWLTAAQAQDVDYWINHTRQPVRFAEAIQTLWQLSGNILLEVGVGQTLGSLALQHPARRATPDALVASSLPSAHARQSDLAHLLRSLGRMWLAGARVDFSCLWAAEQRRRVHLPTYPFQHLRYWPEWQPPTDPRADSTTATDQARSSMSEWFSVPSWQARPLLPGGASMSSRRWLLFADEFGVAPLVARRLSELGHDVVVVSDGASFQRIANDDTYTINSHSAEDYTALIKHLYLANRPPTHVVHLASLDQLGAASDADSPVDVDRTERALSRGFYRVLSLARALANQPGVEATHLWLVSNNAHAVLGDDVACPEQATLLGLLEVLPKENSRLSCANVDFDLRSGRPDVVAEHLLAELCADTQPGVVAYRGRSRWVRTFEALGIDDQAEQRGAARLRRQGAYLISGGFGGLGGALARHLAETQQARLVLLGRTGLPPRETWPALLAQATTDQRIRQRIEQVQELEAAGAEVLPVVADVGNEAEVRRAVTEARARFGQINGVFHTAGIPGQGLIQFKEREAAAQVLWPKVQGTLALATALRDEPLDFLVLYSSINAIIGGLGEADYCAANAFLDAFAHYQMRNGSTQTVSINWGLWRWDAWQSALSTTLPEIYSEIEDLRRAHGITDAEGTRALWRIVAAGQPQVVVSPLPLKTVAERWAALTSLDSLARERGGASNRPAYPRPTLRTAYAAPRTASEARIASIWAEALAVDQVGIHDNFLELGGNSLLAMVIVSRLEREVCEGRSLSAAVLYEGPTVHALAELIDPHSNGQSSLGGHVERGQLRKELRQHRRRIQTR